MNNETYESIFFHPRKSTRIPNFNYASHNYYFVTICTHNRKCLFGNPMSPNALGKKAEQCLLDITNHYPHIIVDKWVIMPNHVHAILIVQNVNQEKVPDLTRAIGQYKMMLSKWFHKYHPGEELWQRSFHDHVIRNQKSYEKIWLYIENNPMKWEEDCFYSSNPIV